MSETEIETRAWEVQPVYEAGVLQPWNQVIFPSADSNWPVWGGMTSALLKSIPAIGRAYELIEGMAAQMALDDVKGDRILPRPQLLDDPDPEHDRAWFVVQQLDDYLTHGNAMHYVTSYDSAGWPATVAWLPAQWVTRAEDGDGEPVWWCGGMQLDTDRIVHVQRGADPWATWRGMGVLEQYARTLKRMVKQETYETEILDGAAVPSVVITTPNAEPSQVELDAAKDMWMQKYGGPTRKPAILPRGSEVKPLAWSPHDSQLVEARKLSLVDAGNVMNIDGYWLGAENGSYQYKSPGPMYLNLLRQTVGPILARFELAWSKAWLPRGRRVQFRRTDVLGDDMSTTVQWVSAAVKSQLMTQSEGRVLLGLSADVPAELKPKPVPPALAEAAGIPPADQVGDQTEEGSDAA